MNQAVVESAIGEANRELALAESELQRAEAAYYKNPSHKTRVARDNAEMWVGGARRRLDAWVSRSEL